MAGLARAWDTELVTTWSCESVIRTLSDPIPMPGASVDGRRLKFMLTDLNHGGMNQYGFMEVFGGVRAFGKGAISTCHPVLDLDGIVSGGIRRICGWIYFPLHRHF